MIPALPDLVGMNAEVGSDLGDHLLSLDGFKGDLGLEGRVVGFPPTEYNTIPPLRYGRPKIHLYPLSRFPKPCQEIF